MPRTPTARVNGHAVRDIRLLRNMTVTELAAHTGVRPQHISNIELETRPCSAVLAGRIAAVLGVRREALLRDPAAPSAAPSAA